MYDLSPYNLREDIATLKSNNLISESDDGYYSGINGFPWSIGEKEGKIFSVFFNKNGFFPIYGDKSAWNLEHNDFIDFMNQVTESVDESYEGDKLYVVFRDFYATMSGIISGRSNGAKEKKPNGLPLTEDL